MDERLRQRFAAAYEDVCALAQIKAEVNYKELGIDDGAEAREQDELQSGSVQKAVITESTIGGGTPGASSLVFFHMAFMREKRGRDERFGCAGRVENAGDIENDETNGQHDRSEGEVVVSTRTEHGGSGVPCLYRLNDGKWRPVRGLEIALLDMPKGERSLVVMKPSMCFLHEDVEDSWMARSLRPLLEGENETRRDACVLAGARFVHKTYKADVEVVGWIDDVVTVDLDNERVAFKRIITEGTGWETPREPFSVELRVTQYTVEQYGKQEVTSAERIVECEIGDGTLSKDLENVICTMRKDEDAVILCPAMASTALPSSSVHSSKTSTWPPFQEFYVEYHVSLIEMTQARDLMGDGKTMKKIIKKGQGEFPIDCPMEDTHVVLRTKIRGKGFHAAYPGNATQDSQQTENTEATEATWLPLMAPSIDEEIEAATGMGVIPPVIDAAVRLMLQGEISVLTTIFDDTLRQFSDIQSFVDGERVEIEVELVRFDTSPPIQLLGPSEKLLKAKEFKEDGNILYKKGMFSLAKSKYNKAINCVGKGFEFSEEEIDETFGIKTSSMLNLAACAQQLGSYSEAIQWCERVLDDDPENTKALFRRSKALTGLAKFDEALADLDIILGIDPSLKDVQREKVLVRRKMKDADAKQRQEFGNFFARQ